MTDSNGSLADQSIQLVRRMAAAWRLTEDELNDAISTAWEFSRAGRGSPSNVAWYAIKRVRSHRRFSGSARSIDHPKRRVQPAQPATGAIAARPGGNPATIVGFRIDFAEWRSRLPERLQTVVDRLADGEEAGEVARLTGVSPARISQIRRLLELSWRETQRQ